MDSITIKEIFSDQKERYKAFLIIGLQNDAENFRISPDDEINAPFPTVNRSDSFTLGAYFGNTLTGVVSFTRDGTDREKLRHKGILFRMYVSNDFRGKGIANKLMVSLINRVKAILDIEQINLTVVANNLRAKQLYEKFGFETFAVEQKAMKWKGNYYTENQMVLRLR